MCHMFSRFRPFQDVLQGHQLPLHVQQLSLVASNRSEHSTCMCSTCGLPCLCRWPPQHQHATAVATTDGCTVHSLNSSEVKRQAPSAPSAAGEASHPAAGGACRPTLPQCSWQTHRLLRQAQHLQVKASPSTCQSPYSYLVGPQAHNMMPAPPQHSRRHPMAAAPCAASAAPAAGALDPGSWPASAGAAGPAGPLLPPGAPARAAGCPAAARSPSAGGPSAAGRQGSQLHERPLMNASTGLPLQVIHLHLPHSGCISRPRTTLLLSSLQTSVCSRHACGPLDRSGYRILLQAIRLQHAATDEGLTCGFAVDGSPFHSPFKPGLHVGHPHEALTHGVGAGCHCRDLGDCHMKREQMYFSRGQQNPRGALYRVFRHLCGALRHPSTAGEQSSWRLAKSACATDQGPCSNASAGQM